MFKRDNPAINKIAQKSEHNLKHMLMMVSLSIKQPWHTVGKQMLDVEESDGTSVYLWGNKRKTYNWLYADRLNAGKLYRDALTYKDDPEALMHVFLRIPGIGLAKAGFCCQLFAGSVGCIDTVNVERLGITAFRFNKNAKEGTKARKVQEYVAFCDKRRSEALWNLWCRQIAVTYPDHFADADVVSNAHVAYLEAAIWA